MKKTTLFLGTFLVLLTLFGCTNQKPVAQAPVYNVTFTDNSQLIIGNNNTPSQSASTSTTQTAKPNVAAHADNTESGMWKLYLALILISGAIIYIYRKEIFAWVKNLIVKIKSTF